MDNPFITFFLTSSDRDQKEIIEKLRVVADCLEEYNAKQYKKKAGRPAYPDEMLDEIERRLFNKMNNENFTSASKNSRRADALREIILDLAGDYASKLNSHTRKKQVEGLRKPLDRSLKRHSKKRADELMMAFELLNNRNNIISK